MKYLVGAFFTAVITCSSLHAQAAKPPHTNEATIEHNGQSATVFANNARPLWQALTAVRLAYCWAIDYEDPPYDSPNDLIPDDPAQHHGKVVLIPAGGAFQSTYPETTDLYASPSSEESVLEKIVSDYNQSGNPGKFIVKPQSDGSYAVIGQPIRNDVGADQPVAPILDIPLSIPQGTRSVEGTIDLITDALSTVTGKKVKVIGGTDLENIPLDAPQVSLGGDNIPARALLLQALQAMPSKMVWSSLCDATVKSCFINVEPLRKYVPARFGGHVPIPREEFDKCFPSPERQ